VDSLILEIGKFENQWQSTWTMVTGPKHTGHQTASKKTGL